MENTPKYEVAEIKQSELSNVSQQPELVLGAAQRVAVQLNNMIEKAKAYVEVKGQKFLKNEAWQTLGRMYGMSARIANVDPIEMNGAKGFKATAELVNQDGVVIGGGVGYCMRSEQRWSNEPDFKLSSMSQTRATSRAYKTCLGWVAVLSGCSGTPAEEMDEGGSSVQAETAAPVAKRTYTKRVAPTTAPVQTAATVQNITVTTVDEKVSKNGGKYYSITVKDDQTRYFSFSESVASLLSLRKGIPTTVTTTNLGTGVRIDSAEAAEATTEEAGVVEMPS